MKKLKILELCQFSAGLCGVWTRAREESLRLSKLGYEVRVFSSNAVKGSSAIACEDEKLEQVKIKRFPFKKLGGESFMEWKFEKQAVEYSPDIIICHNYRHLHTTKALRIRDFLVKQGKKCKVFLVTHAPFVPDGSTRSLLARVVIRFYDSFISPRTLGRFDKIITISHWEVPYLLKAGAKKESLAYIPNGIPEEFFNLKNQAKQENKILFFGRISPIKSIETLIKAMPYIDDKTLKLEIAGPAEESYKKQLDGLIKQNNLQTRVYFSKPIYDLRKKIAKIDSAKIFVLPSKKEGMPQSLIEAMSRSKLVVGSDIDAIKDLITEGKNGYLFKQGDERDLARKINSAVSRNNSNLKKQAKIFVKQFNWKAIIKKIEALF